MYAGKAHQTASPPVGVVIPAAGRSKRFDSAENKIWADLGGKTVLARTLAAFAWHPSICAIVVVAGQDEFERVQAAVGQISPRAIVVAGGDTRAASVQAGLSALPPEIEIVLVHDAARPLVTSTVIDRVIEATSRTSAAVPGTPLSDTVKRVRPSGVVCATIPRSFSTGEEIITGLTAVQTPQGAHLEILQCAYAGWDFSSAEPTDEASLIESTGRQVTVVRGDPDNIKITHPEDLERARRLVHYLESKEQENIPASSRQGWETRTGFGYDVHAFASPEAGRALMLGGVEIEHDCGLEGHSDADVILHAVCDALLGAASLGDIGILFPNTDPAFRGISSLSLLKTVRDRMAAAGWEIIHIDATAVAEAPKLMPHRARMQQAMSACLGIDAPRISIKATTSEKMGFVGRREGIACWAVATIRALSGAS